jgi:SAM-dependent methyltransferase
VGVSIHRLINPIFTIDAFSLPQRKLNHADKTIEFNRQAWDRMAEAGDRFYRAVTAAEIAAARDGDWYLRLTPTKHVPSDWFGDLRGARVMCLAGGGARQAPILAAAGASVTVFDLSEKQLDRDRGVARRENLKIDTVAGDMRDLSHFSDQTFDLIVSPCATCFVPTLQPIWNETFRVLRPGGRFMIGFINPIYYIFDAAKMDRDELFVRHPIPYSDFDLPADERERLLGPERPVEFGHSLQDFIGGQCAAGFRLVNFYEDGWGGNDLLSKKINVFAATLCIK